MNTTASDKRKVLLTGAAGRIGSAFRDYAGERYALRLADRDLGRLGDPGGHEPFLLDAADLEGCRAACAGMDAIIHLAGDPNPRADFYGSLLDSNIKAIYNIFRAAKDQGCGRVVFASSIRALDGYPQGAPLAPDLPPRPLDLYAATKCFGEAVGHYFAYAEGLSSIAIRIGSFNPDWRGRTPGPEQFNRFISRRDMAHLLIRCVETPGIQFAIVHGISDNRIKRLDITSTRELLGYEPEDDAFRFFDLP